MILSEATSVDPMGVGYPDTPGIWSDAQVAGWKLVTDAVHKAGGTMLLQLWHVGRISDPLYLEGALPVAPSAIRPAGTVSLVRPKKEFVTPRALERDEIPAIIAAYKLGAENAKRAGFDGVEVHGANGYLLDQFLQDTTNTRTDDYGGGIENRARLMLEVVDACIGVWGAGRVGLHLAPRGDAHDMGDSNLLATFGYVAEQMKAILRLPSSRATWPNVALESPSLMECASPRGARCIPTRPAPHTSIQASATSSISLARFSIEPP
jgi:2,4-dienoyl-CoA reductase-like NADH-dependent reductase (Old Yellow Enzyme family)